jgi:hypothetical protein
MSAGAGAEISFDERTKSSYVLREVCTSIHKTQNIKAVGTECLEVGFEFMVREEIGVMISNTEIVRARVRK